jgi:prevent-host-death family protein
MITETSAVNFRQNLGEMLNLVQYRNDSILIKKDGKPVAALIDAKLFLRIRQMQERFDALCDRLAQDFAKVPEAEGMAAIEEASAAVRQEMKAEAAATTHSQPLQTTPSRAPKQRKPTGEPVSKAKRAR